MVLVQKELYAAYIGEYKEWKPWANTVLYIPFDQEYWATDQSWNWYTVTNGFTLWTYNNVYCARNTAVGNRIKTGITYTTQHWGNNVFTNPYTVNVRMYIESQPSSNYISWISWFASGGSYPQNNIWMETFTSYSWKAVWNVNTNYWIDYWKWVNVVCTVTPATSWYDYSLYLNWVFQATVNPSGFIGTPSWYHYINYLKVWTSTWSTTVWTCYSEYILENKARTAQEISEYYNITKANYWL